MSAKRVSVFGVLASAAVAFALPVPVQAEEAGVADVGNGICNTGEFCIYRDANRSGPVLDFGKGADAVTYTKLSWPTTGGVVNDKVSSVWNRSSCRVKVFRNGKLQPPAQVFQPSAIANLKDTVVGDDTASSHDACV
jgi:hypothetical protein